MNGKQAAFLLAAATLAGCASAERTTLPGGGQGYSVNCSGIQHNLADCYAQAARVCPTGYTILSKNLNATILNPFQRFLLVSCHP